MCLQQPARGQGTRAGGWEASSGGNKGQKSGCDQLSPSDIRLVLYWRSATKGWGSHAARRWDLRCLWCELLAVGLVSRSSSSSNPTRQNIKISSSALAVSAGPSTSTCIPTAVITATKMTNQANISKHGSEVMTRIILPTRATHTGMGILKLGGNICCTLGKSQGESHLWAGTHQLFNSIHSPKAKLNGRIRARTA